MTEGDSGWKASVDDVVSEFDEVTRHLRRRQGQAVRVAWSVVGATALAMGALIGINLVPPGGGPSAVQIPSSSSPLSVLQPGSSGLPTAPGFPLPPDATLLPSPAAAATSATPVTASAASTPHPHRHLSQVVAPILAAVPVSPRAALTPGTGSPSASPQPSPPPSSPSPAGGILDGLVGGVVHGTG
jgi:hypothetical protein